MNIIILLIFISLVLASLFVLAFRWSVKSGQMDDLYTPSIRILHEEQQLTKSKKCK